ncbi:uncharacterized protein E0L32_004132 [Thyridium curvatum]|uniref:Zn(2)-C6 fungal-type domain-containing protein n=1 Tax=Thyridium curvatum TaxID=1093900 RepID=A0A507B8H9_9PEZI|nr:uncharacterized protein E0L32_004132 [Thyridium curvatum]TPX16137.1 hypothetical protein E0L32_004132 [Thyridium curvatum]
MAEYSNPGGNMYTADIGGVVTGGHAGPTGTPGVGKTSRLLPPPRQLACKRCHGQKLRCIRSQQRRDGTACDRCIAADVACVSRQPRRLGRPLQVNSRDSAHLQSRPEQTHAPGQEDFVVYPAPTPEARPDGQGRAAAAPSFQQEPSQPSREHGNSAMLASPGGPFFQRWPWPDVFSAGSLFPDDGVEPSAEQNQAPELDQVDKAALDVDDPLEDLSKLQIDLYHCLTSIRKVEKFKRGILESKTDPIDPDVDFNWPEKLFRTTESFISSLDAYIARASTESGDANGGSSASNENSPATEEQEAGDAATGLMILGCYTRLLQVLEVMVFVVETFRDLDCPGSFVQVRIGGFAPRGDGDLQARVLGLDGHLPTGLKAGCAKSDAYPPADRHITGTYNAK